MYSILATLLYNYGNQALHDVSNNNNNNNKQYFISEGSTFGLPQSSMWASHSIISLVYTNFF